MNPADAIKTEPLLFDKLLEPISEALVQFDQHPISQAAKKLTYAAFVRVLLFRVFDQIRSLRDLTLDLKTKSEARLLNLPIVGLSTLHDGFARYPVEWLISLIQSLAANHPLAGIGELKALGEVWATDSSYWPVVNQLGWLASQGLQGVRLHLGLSLNTMCVAAFLLTYDAASSSSEKACLLQMAQASVTYVMDRGYVSIAFCRELMDRRAFFVIRERNNLQFRSLCELAVETHCCLQRLSSISDQIIKLTRDKDGTILRLVSFTACGHQFRLLTNRFDLATHQIVLLYAWRWQVELIFRAWKHTLGGLHLINLSEAGIAAQFHILLLASIVWTLLQQTSESLAPTVSPASEMEQSSPKARTITAQVSQIFSGRLALTPTGAQTLQELPGSKLLVLSQRASGFSPMNQLLCRTLLFFTIIFGVALIVAICAVASAQTFSSGSTGANGSFAPPAPPQGQTVEVVLTLPPDGVFHFTTVTIPRGVKVTFIRNAKNTPAVILATGDIRIEGSISVAGQPVPSQGSTYLYNSTNYGGVGGPGGFNGGSGASAIYAPGDTSCDVSQLVGFTGDGPGGGAGAPIGPAINGVRKGGGGGGGGFFTAGQPGQASNQAAGGAGGERYGSPTLIPLIGGSGGGGSPGECDSGPFSGSRRGAGGAGGGGAILIASSTKIILDGPTGDSGYDQEQPVVDARGGDVYTAWYSRGGAGSGGAIRLIANEITGQGWISARGGRMTDLSNFPSGGNGGDGIIRLETSKLTFAGKTLPQALYSLPGSADINAQPSLVITSVGGVAAPNPPVGSLQSNPDVTIPDNQSNQTITMTTAKIPVGTRIRLTVVASDGSFSTVLSNPVTGAFDSGSATATVILPTGMSLVRASAIFVKP